LDDTALAFGDDIWIELPDTSQHLTPFVIREQFKWFEHKFHFPNTFMQLGMKIIVIGVNFGDYTLSVAKEL